MATSVTLKPNAIDISGSTSGTTTLQASAVAGTTTLTLPAATDTLVGKATTDTLTNKTLTGAAMNGTLGATTPSTASVTTLTTSSTVTHSGGTANGVAYLNTSKQVTTGSALTFDGTNLSLGTVGAKVNFATTGSATVNYVGGSADGYSLEMVMQRGASQPLKYKQDYAVGHVWSVAGSDKLTLDSSGNLGIGVTSMSQRLVAGGSANTRIQVDGSSTGGIYFTQSGSNAGTISGSTSAMMFYAPGASESMRLDSSGNLLVGTTSTSGLITSSHNFVGKVASDYSIGFNSTFSTAGQNYGIAVKYTVATPNNTASEFFYCADSTAQRVRFVSNGGLYNYQANNSNLSDRREKTNFAPAGDYLAKICAIPVQTFNYIDQNLEEDDGLTLGVIAQDVQEVAPELVMESNWGTPEQPKMRLSIYQTDLQYALMKCIQEQQAIIQSLTARITALESA